MAHPTVAQVEGLCSSPRFDQCTTTADRVWTLDDLQILHELQTPVAVIVPNFVEQTPERPQGRLGGLRTVFQNSECLRQYGLPRPDHIFFDAMASMPNSVRQAKIDWFLKIIQAKGQMYRSRVDLHGMLGAQFENVNDTMPHALARLESKPIRMQTSRDKVEVGVMHVLETDPSRADLGAMLQRTPLHTYMFDAQGRLLNANKAAFEAFQSDPPDPSVDRKITLRKLFGVGAYPGGQEEAQAAYEEAYNDVFNLHLDCHRHAQPHRSRRDGHVNWHMIEMWPMQLQDPVDASPAVLVKKYDITEQKDLELKLSIQQQELQRQNQELERYSATMLEDKLRLQEQANSLEQRLEAVLQDKFLAKSFDAETPIDKTLAYLHSVIKGEVPPLQAALDLYHILSESDTDLRQPVALKKQLLREYSLDADVGQSMLLMLQGNNAAAPYVYTEDPASVLLGQPAPAVQSPTQPSPDSELHHNSSLKSQQMVSPNSVGGLQSQRTPKLAFGAPMITITPDLERRLQDAGSNWQFDMFSFAEVTPGHTLSLLAMHIIRQSGLGQHFQVIEPRYWQWVQCIESGHDPNNPYHNSVHVASVLQMTHMMLTHGGIIQSNAMNTLEVFCAYWSAITHDFEHGGVNNDFLASVPSGKRKMSLVSGVHALANGVVCLVFLHSRCHKIRTSHPWAICYNDQAPLENHHLAAAVKLSFRPELRHVQTEADWVQARRLCINMVLGTDMKKHFDIVSRFQAAFKPAQTNSNSKAATDWAAVKLEDKYLMHQMVLKCADIGHLAADVATHRRWAYQLEEEFFRQGDKERELGLPISPLMDRAHQGGMTRSQVGFLSIVGIPLFKAVAELFEGTQPMLEGVLANYRQWEAAAASSVDASVK